MYITVLILVVVIVLVVILVEGVIAEAVFILVGNWIALVVIINVTQFSKSW